MASELPSVITGYAVVYHYDGHRYLTKRAAYGAKARDVMRGEDHTTGGDCECAHCVDKYLNRSAAHKVLTRKLMKERTHAE